MSRLNTASLAVTAAVIVGLLLTPGCSDDRRVFTPAVDDDVSPRESREAEEAALWLSGELHAPDALYDTIKSDLARIRRAYLFRIPELRIEFRPWWHSSRLVIEVTEEVRQALLAGEPTLVDSLNTVFRATSMDTSRLNAVPGTYIDFEGRYHPDRLAEIYEDAGAVLDACRDSWIGDYSNAYPWHIDGGMSYLFREGSGDCLSGCIHNRFWYFRVVDDHIRLVGYWDRSEPEPDWWAEGRVAFYQFYRCEYGSDERYCSR